MTAVAESTGGRLIPRGRHRAEPCDVRFHGERGGVIVAVCKPCAMMWHLAAGHTAADLARFTAQHQGQEDT